MESRDSLGESEIDQPGDTVDTSHEMNPSLTKMTERKGELKLFQQDWWLIGESLVRLISLTGL